MRRARGAFDGQASVAWLSNDLSADAVGDLVDGNDGTGYAFSIEAGRKMPVGGSWSLTPQAQLAYTSVDFHGFTGQFGAEVTLESGDSLKGRIGLALDYDEGTGESPSHVYGIANTPTSSWMEPQLTLRTPRSLSSRIPSARSSASAAPIGRVAAGTLYMVKRWAPAASRVATASKVRLA